MACIKIVHVIYRLDFGGLENGLVNLINRSPVGFEHIIVTQCGVNPEFSKRIQIPVQLFDLVKQPGQDKGMYLRLYRLLKQINPDIVHTRNLATIECQIPAFLAGVPYRIHGEHGWDVSDPEGRVRKYQFLRRICGLFIHRFVPLSSHLETYLTSAVGIPAKKVTRICNGVDLSRFKPKSESKSDDGVLKLICVGRLEQIKGHRYLLEALNLLKQQKLAEKVNLTLVGEGSCRDSLMTYISKNDLSHCVNMIGARSDIPELMQEAQGFVLPSEAEGISNTVLEAMATGLPVIATQVGGNSDLIVPEETGFLVPSKSPAAMAEAIRVWLANPAKRVEQGKRAAQRAKATFSLEAMAANYYNLYSKQSKLSGTP